MANDYTNTSEHYIPVPAITDQWNFTREITNLRTRLNNGMAGQAAYVSDADNYVLAAANAGKILSSQHGGVGGSVIGAASGQDPTLTFYTNTGAALVAEWTIGADDDNTDALTWSTGADLTAQKMTLTEGGKLGVGETAPLGRGHFKTADSGGSVSSGADEIVAEGSGAAGITVLSGNTANSNVYFGDDGDDDIGRIQYNHNTDDLVIRTNAADRVRIMNTGNVLIGTARDPGGTASKVLIFGDNGGDPTPGLNTAGMFAKDVAGTVEMFAVDEADNVSQISPHDPITGNAYVYSTNRFTGKTTRIWTERGARLLEAVAAQLGIAHEPIVEVEWMPRADRLDWDTEQARQQAARADEIAQWETVDVVRAAEIALWDAMTDEDRGDTPRPVPYADETPRPETHVVKPAPEFIAAVQLEEGA